MTELEENKLVAEFMEANIFLRRDYNDCKVEWAEYSKENNPKGSIAQVHNLSNSEYRTSWNWLMPVIEKISVLDIPDPDGVSESWNPFPRTFGIPSDDNPGFFLFRFNRHKVFECETLIEAAYTAVIDFLTTYKS